MQAISLLRCLPAAALFTTVLFSGCMNTSVIATGAQPAGPPVTAESVRVFLSERDAPKDMVTLASINVSWPGPDVDELTVVRALQKRAAVLGANGIVLNTVERGHAAISGESHARADALAIYSAQMPPVANYNEQHVAVVRFGGTCFHEPQTGGSSSGTLRAGSTVSVTAANKAWAQVKAGDRTCFVELDRLIAPY